MVGTIFVEDMRDILRRMLSVDINEGHNSLSFDIDKFVQSVTSQRVYAEQSTDAAREVKQLLTEFRNRRTGPDGVRNFFFAQDTLDSAKVAMQVERNRIGEQIRLSLGEATNLPTNATQRSNVIEEITSHLLGDFSLSDQLGSSRPDSLENLFLNTNFFDLLEKEDPSKLRPIFEALERGGEHTSDVDAILNAYLSEYINTDVLRIRRFPTVGQNFDTLSPEAVEVLKQRSFDIEERLQRTENIRKPGEKFSQFAEYMRARIARSGSVTPVTNVADVRGLSSELFDYLSKDQEGRRRMTVTASLDDLENLRSKSK